jgi:hypothetical protein
MITRYISALIILVVETERLGICRSSTKESPSNMDRRIQIPNKATTNRAVKILKYSPADGLDLELVCG